MRATFLLLPLILAACGRSATPATDNVASVEPVGYSDTQRRVVELPDEQRRGVFLRAIRDGNAPCQGVTEDVRQEDQDGNPLYAVRCIDGPVYAISIDRTGTAVVARVSPERRG